MRNNLIALVLLVVVVLTVITAIYPGGSQVANYSQTVSAPETNLPSNFEYVIYDGMPCIRNTMTAHAHMLTCDLSRWNGNIDGNEIILP